MFLRYASFTFIVATLRLCRYVDSTVAVGRIEHAASGLKRPFYVDSCDIFRTSGKDESKYAYIIQLSIQDPITIRTYTLHVLQELSFCVRVVQIRKSSY